MNNSDSCNELPVLHFIRNLLYYSVHFHLRLGKYVVLAQQFNASNIFSGKLCS